jgi:hypothetical protein
VTRSGRRRNGDRGAGELRTACLHSPAVRWRRARERAPGADPARRTCARRSPTSISRDARCDAAARRAAARPRDPARVPTGCRSNARAATSSWAARWRTLGTGRREESAAGGAARAALAGHAPGEAMVELARGRLRARGPARRRRAPRCAPAPSSPRRVPHPCAGSYVATRPSSPPAGEAARALMRRLLEPRTPGDAYSRARHARWTARPAHLGDHEAALRGYRARGVGAHQLGAVRGQWRVGWTASPRCSTVHGRAAVPQARSRRTGLALAGARPQRWARTGQACAPGPAPRCTRARAPGARLGRAARSPALAAGRSRASRSPRAGPNGVRSSSGRDCAGSPRCGARHGAARRPTRARAGRLLIGYFSAYGRLGAVCRCGNRWWMVRDIAAMSGWS